MTVYTQTVNIGSSFEQTFVYTVNDQPVNLSGWGAVFRLRDENDRVISTVRYGDTGDRALTIDASHGSIDVTMVASATSGFTAKTGTFELEIYDLLNTGRVFRVIDGAVRYRPRGRAMLDNTVCVIRSTSNAVTVETQQVSQYQRIDRGPPGATGSAALDSNLPTIEENPSAGSSPLAPKADRQYGLVTSSRHGFMRYQDKSDHDYLVNSVAFYVPEDSGSTATNYSRIQGIFALAAVVGNCCIVLPKSPFPIGSNRLSVPPSQGIRICGEGSSQFAASPTYTGGSKIVYSGGGDQSFDAQTTGTSASSVAIGTGDKTFTIASGKQLSAGVPIRFTATAGATGTMTGIVWSYTPDGTSCVVRVQSVTGSGTGTAWDYTTLIDAPILTVRSHTALTLEGFTIECTNSAFAGAYIDNNGLSLGSDSGNCSIERVTCWNSAAAPDASNRPFGNAAWAVYATGCNNLHLAKCRFYGGLNGLYHRGIWLTVDSTNNFSFHANCAVDTSSIGGIVACRVEPTAHFTGSSYLHNGINIYQSHGMQVSYNYGDAFARGPVIRITASVMTEIHGTFAVFAGGGGAGECPIQLIGASGTKFFGDDSLCNCTFDVSGQISLGLYGVSFLSESAAFFGSNITMVNMQFLSAANTYGTSGMTRIEYIKNTNGAEFSLGALFTGTGVVRNNYLAIMGSPGVQPTHGGTSGMIIGIMPSIGLGAGMGFWSTQNDTDGGFFFNTYDASAGTEKQSVQVKVSPSVGLQLTRGDIQYASSDYTPTALADADATITISGGHVRTIASTAANRAITLGTTGAKLGQRLTIMRNDTAAFTWTFTGAESTVFPASKLASATWQYNGTAWQRIQLGVGS